MTSSLGRLSDAKIRALPFEQRQAALRQRPEMAALERRLLALGGKRVAMLPEPDADRIVREGGVFLGAGPRLSLGEPSGCHGNVARLWLRNPKVDVVTGWALSPDGCWRQHSWGIEEGRWVETTEPRVLGLGLRLTGRERVVFALQNAIEETPPEMGFEEIRRFKSVADGCADLPQVVAALSREAAEWRVLKSRGCALQTEVADDYAIVLVPYPKAEREGWRVESPAPVAARRSAPGRGLGKLTERAEFLKGLADGARSMDDVIDAIDGARRAMEMHLDRGGRLGRAVENGVLVVKEPVLERQRARGRA